MSDDHELGQIMSMVTVTQNNFAPKLIAHARRCPCALPTQQEKFAYFLTRNAPSHRQQNTKEDSTASVLSHQLRILSVKRNFLVRHKRTSLSANVANWDRTEAQTRQALQGHVLA